LAAVIPLPARKRAFDLVVAGLTTPLWLPVFLVCCLAILVLDGRPIFYTSRRRVHGRQSLPVVKFRAMVRNADRIVNRATRPATTQGFLNIAPSDAVYTSIGRWLERCCFTELPQVFQVIRGNMSIVGSRPLPENVIDTLRVDHRNVEDRFLLPCGLTGPVQLVGRTQISDRDRLRLEAAYCRRCLSAYSIVLDLRILLHTVLVSVKVEPLFSVDVVARWLEGDEWVPLGADAERGVPDA
jgi:lipopolysaccharide/colanic/teichoic acid biosynthesis glycosyltransferase